MALASLLFLDDEALARALVILRRALVPGGFLMASRGVGLIRWFGWLHTCAQLAGTRQDGTVPELVLFFGAKGPGA